MKKKIELNESKNTIVLKSGKPTEFKLDGISIVNKTVGIRIENMDIGTYEITADEAFTVETTYSAPRGKEEEAQREKQNMIKDAKRDVAIGANIRKRVENIEKIMGLE